MRRRQAERAEQAADAEAYREQQEAAAQQAAIDQAVAAQMAAQQAAPPPPPPAAPAGDDLIAKLNELGQLKAQGILSDEEFAAAKAKLLG
jgi:hypothetical protein